MPRVTKMVRGNKQTRARGFPSLYVLPLVVDPFIVAISGTNTAVDNNTQPQIISTRTMVLVLRSNTRGIEMDAWLLCISALLLVGSALNLPTEGSLKEDSLLTLAAGEGQNATDEEEEKTLSQQIVEGKYGLIQKELYSEKPRRPGVLSYADNLEVPRDTADNYGGLDSGEIWLAENHVLVLRGGHFLDHNSSEGTRTRPVWPPLDGYQAPARQVKIPPNPKVPPPFPVQLREGGPTQFIGPNGTLFPVPGNGSYFGPFPPGDPFLPPPGFNRSTPFSPSGNVSTGNGPFFPLPPRPFPGFPFPLPPPPGVFPPINGTLPMLPPGGMFLPPPDNLTDLYDEDDPSIYYPPPYDFFYQRDNSTPVPPGPLVPGIVLPPPPDFFAPLVNSTPTPLTTVRYKPQPITTTPQAHVIKEVTTATVDLSTTTPNSLKLEVIPVKQQLPELRPFDVPSDYDELNAILYPSSAPVVSYNLDPVTDIVVRPRPSYSYKPPQKPTYILEYESYKGRQPDYYYYDEVTQRSKATPAPPKASYYYDEVTQRSKATPSPPKGSYYYDEVTQRSKATPSPPKASYYYDEVTQRSKATPAPPKASYYYDEVTQRSKVTPAPPKASYYYYEEPHISVAHVSHIPSLSPRPLLDLSRLTQAERFLLQQISGLVHKTTSAPRYNYYSPKAQDYYNSGPVVYYNSGSPREQEYYSSPRYYTSPKPHNYYSGIPRSQNYYANIPSPQNYYSTPSAQNYYSTTPSPQNYYNAPRAQNYYSTTPSPPDYYSTPEAQNHYSTTPRPSYSSAPRPQRYYSSTTTPQPVYYSPSQTVSYYQPHTTPHPQQEAAVTNPTILRHKSPPAPTSNPLNSAYFTKQDESLLDDITKKYFTIFGQKLPESPGATTPLPPSSDRGHEPRLRQKQQQQPKSLETDLLVNYRQPLPAFNPKSELVDVYSQTKDGSGALVSYNLPGDSGHVYFITPQLVGGPGYSHKVPERQLVYPSKREDS
uniref:Uncharacterized protein n=1 Tax=Timema tahoe TaxID=61484 RepID=A0A7R9P142_9NEOP|nr:unnamed protein product [Timema tahoe]